MDDGVGTPRAPRFGDALGARGPRLAQRLQHAQVGGEESVGPAQRAHRDVVGGPGTDAGKRGQRSDRRVDIAFGLETIFPDAIAEASSG